MSWACELSRDAEEDLTNLPKAIQKRVARVLTQMESEPFEGNVRALRGERWKGVFRRRIGDYRILFNVEREKSAIFVLRIVLRSEKTYQ